MIHRLRVFFKGCPQAGRMAWGRCGSGMRRSDDVRFVGPGKRLRNLFRLLLRLVVVYRNRLRCFRGPWRLRGLNENPSRAPLPLPKILSEGSHVNSFPLRMGASSWRVVPSSDVVCSGSLRALGGVNERICGGINVQGGGVCRHPGCLFSGGFSERKQAYGGKLCAFCRGGRCSCTNEECALGFPVCCDAAEAPLCVFCRPCAKCASRPMPDPTRSTPLSTISSNSTSEKDILRASWYPNHDNHCRSVCSLAVVQTSWFHRS